MQIDELNQRFGIPGVAEVMTGNGGLAKVRITAPAAAGEVYLHGAQVTSWRPAGAEEVIFVSRQSHWEPGRAVRGGIPICFPWFRGKAHDPKAPAHGIVRTKDWSLDSITAEKNGSVTVACKTESDDTTRRWWPHQFQMVHRINVGRSLSMELTATNNGNTEFRFEEALHTYFRAGDVERVEVRGLAGMDYLDNMDGNRRKIQASEAALSTQTDNAYLNAERPIDIYDPVLQRVLRTEKANSASTIVWNPWRDGAAKLADLGDDEWRQMICVEGGNILDAAVSLHPGKEHTMRVALSVTAT